MECDEFNSYINEETLKNLDEFTAKRLTKHYEICPICKAILDHHNSKIISKLSKTLKKTYKQSKE